MDNDTNKITLERLNRHFSYRGIVLPGEATYLELFLAKLNCQRDALGQMTFNGTVDGKYYDIRTMDEIREIIEE